MNGISHGPPRQVRSPSRSVACGVALRSAAPSQLAARLTLHGPDPPLERQNLRVFWPMHHDFTDDCPVERPAVQHHFDFVADTVVSRRHSGRAPSKRCRRLAAWAPRSSRSAYISPLEHHGQSSGVRGVSEYRRRRPSQAAATSPIPVAASAPDSDAMIAERYRRCGCGRPLVRSDSAELARTIAGPIDRTTALTATVRSELAIFASAGC